MCDMTHVWHDSCVTWLICVMTPAWHDTYVTSMCIIIMYCRYVEKVQHMIKGGEDASGALSCGSFSAKEPWLQGSLAKWCMKIRPPIHLRNPVFDMTPMWHDSCETWHICVVTPVWQRPICDIHVYHNNLHVYTYQQIPVALSLYHRAVSHPSSCEIADSWFPRFFHTSPERTKPALCALW